MKGLLLLLPLVLAAATVPPADEVYELNERARAALEQGRFAAAVRDLEKACALAPDEPVLRHNLAQAFFRRGRRQLASQRLDAAAEDFRRAIRHHPEEGGYVEHLAQLELRRYRLASAQRLLADLVQRQPGRAQAWMLLGDALNLLDRLEQALQAYERAVAAGAGDLLAKAQRALERTRLQHSVEADYLTDVSGFFVIRYPHDRDGALFGARLAGLLERARAEVCNALDIFPTGRVTVVLYPPDAFRRVTGAQNWVGGLFDRKIRLPIADPDRDRASIEAAFRHEFTHLVVAGLSPLCPTLLNEGLAQVMEQGRGRGMGRLAAFLDKRGGRASLPPLASLPDRFLGLRDREAVSAAYLHSYAFVDHVVSLHGLGAALRWVKATASRPLDEAYLSVVGRSLAQEETLFRDLLRGAR